MAGGRDNDASGKAPSLVVKSEVVDVVNDTPQGAAPASGDPVVTFGSLGGRFADDARFPEYEDGDSTECSSSFDASHSGSYDGLESDIGATEVDSTFQPHISIEDTTVVPHLVKNKKVTAEWRKYIGSVMWRCQWLELRMKDLLSQVAKYDKELAIINHEKDLQLEMMKADCPNSGLQQLNLQSHERNTMKRRKRKRDEDIMDSSLSTEKHLILSYYNEKQKKKTETDELLDDDDINSLGVENINSLGLNDILASLEFKENDAILEQYSLRDIILSIDKTQSRIIALQNHLIKASDTVDRRQKTKKSQKRKNLDSFLQNDAGSVDIAQSDEDEVTVKMLFGTDNPLNDTIRGLYKESVDDVLIDNQAAREEGFCQFERISQKAEEHLDLVTNVYQIPSSEEKNCALVNDEYVSIPTPIVKRGPKSKNKHNTKRKQVEEDTGNSIIEETVLVAVDTRRSQRVRKPKVYK